MKNNDIQQTKKQTFEDIILGEEPTEEYLEEFRALNESEQISEDELTKLALASNANSINSTDNPLEPDYKTNESSLFNILIIAVVFSIALYLLIT